MSRKFRFFRGFDTGQLNGATGGGPDILAWYYEPIDYNGRVLWSRPFATKAEAKSASLGGRPRSTKRGSSVPGSKRVSVRVSAEEYVVLQQNAEMAGAASIAEWLRNLGLGDSARAV